MTASLARGAALRHLQTSTAQAIGRLAQRPANQVLFGHGRRLLRLRARDLRVPLLLQTAALVKAVALRRRPTSTAEGVGPPARRPANKVLLGHGRRLSRPRARARCVPRRRRIALQAKGLAQRPQPTSTAKAVGLHALRPVSKGLPEPGRRLSRPRAQDLRAQRLLRTALLVRERALRPQPTSTVKAIGRLAQRPASKAQRGHGSRRLHPRARGQRVLLQRRTVLLAREAALRRRRM